MHIRNTGESFPRPFPRLQRPRRLRRGTFYPDFKRRTSPTCSPSPLRKPAHGLLPPAAATSVSNAPACWCTSPRLHRYRGTFTTPPVASPSASLLHVAPLPFLIQCGLFANPAASAKSQAQSCRGTPSTIRSSKPHGATAARPVRASAWIYTSPAIPPGIFPHAISTTSDSAIRCGADSSSPSPPHPRSLL